MQIVQNGFIYKFLELIGLNMTNPQYLFYFSCVVAVLLGASLIALMTFLFKFLVYLRK